MHGKFPCMQENFPKLQYFPVNFPQISFFSRKYFPMVLLHDISGKIPMHLMNLFLHAWKETTHLFFGNFSTTANISMCISNSVLTEPRKTEMDITKIGH
jgi:hypothetical protein